MNEIPRHEYLTGPRWVYVGTRPRPQHEAWRQLDATAAVDCFRSFERALASSVETPPRVTLIAQPTAHFVELAELVAWRRRYPLTRCILWEGPWICGRDHCAPSLLDIPRFAWWQSWEVLKTISEWLRGDCAPDPFSGAADGRAKWPDSVPRLPFWVASRDATYQRTLTDLLVAWGWSTVDDPGVSPLWGLFDQADRTDWSRWPGWEQCAARVALIDFPQPQDRGRLLGGAYDALCGKPFRAASLARIVEQLGQRVRVGRPS